MTAVITRETLRTMRCKPLSGPPVPEADVAAQLQVLTGWGVDGDGIARTFRFANYARTMAFVSAVASLAEREDHHPDLQVSWGRCTVRWSTHSAGGVSLNDFICAAATDALFDEAEGA